MKLLCRMIVPQTLSGVFIIIITVILCYITVIVLFFV